MHELNTKPQELQILYYTMYIRTLFTLCIQGIVNTRSSNIFAQASFSAPVFEVARSVIGLFEEGKLKGQKEIRELATQAEMYVAM